MAVGPGESAAPPPEGASDRLMTGVLWMVVTTFFFVAMTVAVRMVGTDLPAAEAAFIRYALGVALLLPAFRGLFVRKPTGSVMRLYALRGAVHGVGVILWFYAMARIPIAEVTALGYTAPVFVAVLAAVFLGERLRLRRIAAVLCGLLGTIIILRPGFQEIGAGQLAQLGATPLFAISFVIAKKLTATTRPAEIVAMLSLGCTAMLAPFALAEWRDPTWEELFWLAAAAVTATTAHYTMTRAMEAAPITATQPITFLQLVWATILGVILFGEPADPFVIAGGAVIVGAATFIAHREAAARRRAAPRVSPAAAPPPHPAPPPADPGRGGYAAGAPPSARSL